jgi:ureidoglycolate hydrolase
MGPYHSTSFFSTRGHDEDNKIKSNNGKNKKYHKYSQHATSSNLSHILMTRSHPLDHHHPLNNPNHPSIFSPKPKKKKKKNPCGISFLAI